MKSPTPKAIAAEIALLKLQKPRLPNSAFGDDNHAACSAQIYTLENKLSEFQIYERYEGDETSDEGRENAEADQHALDSALEAGRWLRGEEKDAPSKGWEPIVDRAQGKFK